MAFVFANSVKETTTTTGTGTLDLAGAATGFRTFVAGVGSTNTTCYTLEDANGAWEHGIGTVTDAATDTLSRTTILSSSTGSAINLSAGTHTVYCAWPAERAQQVNLEHVAGTDAATSMAVGQMYVVDMSAWATADRTYTLPATAAVGDRCGIMVSSGNASFELLVTAAAGDTLNAIAGGTEWSRLFITGETLIFRCIAASATWVVEHDGRIAMAAFMYLSTSPTANESAGTLVYATAASPQAGVWTASTDVGNITAVATEKITARRACRANMSIQGFTVNNVTVANYFQPTLYFNATTYLICPAMYQAATGSGRAWGTQMNYPFAANDYVRFQYRSQEGSKGLATGSGTTYFSFEEVLP